MSTPLCDQALFIYNALARCEIKMCDPNHFPIRGVRPIRVLGMSLLLRASLLLAAAAMVMAAGGKRQRLLRRGIGSPAGGIDRVTSRALGGQQLPQMAMPPAVYEETLKRAQFGQRPYPTQEDSGGWDDLSEGSLTRGGTIGFSLSGTEMDTDLPMEERIPAEES